MASFLTRTIRTLGALGALALGASSAAAEEAKVPVSAALLLDMLRSPVESRGAAFDEALKQPGPPPARPTVGEVQPDGSVRYGSVTVTVKNPCPPGTAHYEPPPLPGRRAKN